MSTSSTDLLGPVLKGVSRSFYLTLRALPPAIRPQIGLGYLLARTSDTIADTELVPLGARLETLRAFRRRVLGEDRAPLALGEFTRPAARVALGSGTAAAEGVLLERIEESLARLEALAPDDRQRVREVLEVITSGQELDLERFAEAGPSHVVALETDDDLDEYTYLVAGCVGEFWTRMCRAHLFPQAPVEDEFLLTNGVRLGRGLQLVNILRDLPRDLRKGRCYLPAQKLATVGLKPADLLNPLSEQKLSPLYHDWITKAEARLMAGWQYVNALPRAQFRVRVATAWPVLIGLQTLAQLRGFNALHPELHIKISRGDVRRVVLTTLVLHWWPAKWNRLASRARRGSPPA